MSGPSPLKGLLLTARPRQWSKNVVVLAAPGAAGVLNKAGPLGRSLACLALFGLVASGTYFFNDVLDAPADRLHPTKRRRPVAAGTLKPATATAAGVILTGAGVALGVLLRPRVGLVLGIYVILQLAYSRWLKHLPIYDLVCVAAGFVLRALAGAVAVPVPVSEWFLIVTTFGSLLMVTGKRLAEHAELGTERGGHRATLDAYDPRFLVIVLAISATGALVGYSLWAFGLEAAVRHHADGIWFQVSIVPVFVALLHYTLMVERGRGARPEELVLHDRHLQVLGLLWAALFALGVYG